MIRGLLFGIGMMMLVSMINIPIALIILFIAFLMPAKPKKIKDLPQVKTPPKMATASTWKSVAQSKTSVAIHKGLASEFSDNNHFDQIIYSNLHFLSPLSEPEARLLMQEASKAAIAGHRAGCLTDSLIKLLPHATKGQLREIARTASSKCQAAITQTRAERLGLYWYIWRSCGDARVRPSHANLDGVICSFREPPQPEVLIGDSDSGAYHPGESRECRCYAEPVVDIDFVDFPAKVLMDGKLIKMGRRKFKALTKN